MFVARLDRVDGEYVVIVPHDFVVQQNLHEGQVISVVVEPLAEYAQVEAGIIEPEDARWKLNEDASAYRGHE